jgi:PTS system nitrogen regulatory IIA component
MKISDLLSPDDVLIDIKATGKLNLLQELCRRAAAHLTIPEEVILKEILKREQLGSTGMGNGIAIPHTRVGGIGKAFGLLARLYRAIDFESVDAAPVDLVFLLLLPATSHDEQLKALALVARKLKDPDLLEKLRAAPNAQSLHKAIA